MNHPDYLAVALALGCALAMAAPAAAFDFGGNGSQVDAHRSITLLNGTTIQAGFWAAVNPDCSSSGQITPRLVSPPAHGRLHFASALGFVRFSPFNPRAECNWSRVRGLRVTYTAQRGYSGDDSYEVDYYTPTGRLIHASVSVEIR